MPKEQLAPKAGDKVSETLGKLRRLIVLGTLAPGSPLIERRVAEILGESRAAVRGALQRLEQEGYVVVSRIGDRYSRFSVAPITSIEMNELLTIFGALDGIAAGLAARLPEEKRKKVAREARRLHEDLRRVGESDEPKFEAICEIDQRLHNTYVEAAAGPRLLAEYREMRPQVERYARFYATALIRELPRAVLAEHEAIIDAVEMGDPVAAERAAVENWRNAANRFERVMRDLGELGTFDTGLSDSGGPPVTAGP